MKHEVPHLYLIACTQYLYKSFSCQMTVLTDALGQLHVGQSGLPILFQVDSPLGHILVGARNHLDAFDDGADGVAQGASSAQVFAYLRLTD